MKTSSLPAIGAQTEVTPFGQKGWITAIAAGVVYAIFVINAVVGVVQYVQLFWAVGLEVTGPMWTLLILAILMPAIIFGLALLVSRRLVTWARVLVYFVGITVVSVLAQTLGMFTVLASPLG